VEADAASGVPAAGSPISAHFAATSAAGGMTVSVDHYLLRLPQK